MSKLTQADSTALERWILPLVENMTDSILFSYRSDLRDRLYKLSRAEDLMLKAIESETEIRTRRHELMKYRTQVA